MNMVVFLLILALATVKAQRSCEQELQDGCMNDYNQRSSSRASSSQEALCLSLTIYSKCITDIKETTPSCQSNLLYRLVATYIGKGLKDNHCGNISLANFSIPQPVTPPVMESMCGVLRRKSMSSTISTQHCGLFGDPHLRTFGGNTETCVVEGAWPMVDNKFLAVQVTNVYLLPGLSEATATSKITVMIKRHKGCSKQKTFQALAHRLPAVFMDGSRETGPKECPTRVEEIIKGSLIHIDICYIKTKIIIRQVGQFLTFHIRMPQEIVGNTTKGLCVSGCPTRERIDYRELLSYTDSELLGRAKLTRREATKKCRDKNVSGFYLDSCLFDLLTTGDANFSAAAKSAMDDAFSLDPAGTVKDLNAYNVTVARNETKVNGGIRARNNAADVLYRRLFLFLLPYILVFTSY